MKTSILTTTSFAVLLSSLGLVACGGSEVEPADQTQGVALTQDAQKAPAPEAMRPEARGEHRGPRGERRFGPPSPEKMLARFDANGNGQLEAAELPERMQERIGDIDASGDGVVSKAELETHFNAKRVEHQAKFAERAKKRFDEKDANHDGMLEAAEVGDHWAKLSVADANGDQKLTPDELRAAFEAGKLGPMRGAHGRGFPGKADPTPSPAAAPTPSL